MLEEMKTASDLGFQQGDRFVYKWGNPHERFEYGDVLTLIRDDFTACPRFRCDSTGKSGFCFLSMLEPHSGERESGYGALYSITMGDVTAFYASAEHLLMAVDGGCIREKAWICPFAQVVVNTRTKDILKDRRTGLTTN